MHSLIKYCYDKGLNNFIVFKFERKSKYIMVEHFVSNKDVKTYDLYLYVNKDEFGRYKLSKYVSKKLSYICEYLLYGNSNDDNIDNIIKNIDKNIKKCIYKQRLIKLKKLKNI